MREPASEKQFSFGLRVVILFFLAVIPAKAGIHGVLVVREGFRDRATESDCSDGGCDTPEYELWLEIASELAGSTIN